MARSNSGTRSGVCGEHLHQNRFREGQYDGNLDRRWASSMGMWRRGLGAKKILELNKEATVGVYLVTRRYLGCGFGGSLWVVACLLCSVVEPSVLWNLPEMLGTKGQPGHTALL
jgi:hypothetical protein